MKLLEKIANVALILGVTAFLFVVIRGEMVKRSHPGLNPQDLVGKTVSLPGLQLNSQHNSLLVAISTTCHFCRDSVPFYKELTAKTQGKVDVIAVLPQPVADGRQFLQSEGFPGAHVVSATLDSIGVNATPTLLLVDSRGKVQEAWIGLLNEKARQAVAERILR